MTLQWFYGAMILCASVSYGWNPDVRTTTTKFEFIRDDSNPKLGEAWRDPSGMIWGDIVPKRYGRTRDTNHKDATLSHKDATDHCREMGAQLPTQRDFSRLREYMGAKPWYESTIWSDGVGYSPQVLPNLSYEEDGETSGHLFWSSTLDPEHKWNAYYFNGRYGGLNVWTRTDDKRVAVRCVFRPRPSDR